MSSYVTKKTDGNTEWFVQDRFGMFIHFGLYAMPARHEWIKTYELISEEKYDKYFQYFNPDLFDAKEWARKAKEAGMKYAVLTTKHHEGFCMFDSKYTDYKITKFEKNIYNYNRIIFENIDLNATKNNTSDTPATSDYNGFYLLLNVYYADDVVLSSPMGIIPIYDNEYFHEPIDISKNLFKDNKPTEGLSSPIEYTIKEESDETQE